MNTRILVFINHFFPYKGGLENAVLSLYGRWKVLEPEVEIDVVCNDTERAGPFESVKGLNVHRMECWAWFGRNYSIPKPAALACVLRTFRKRRFDAVHTHTRFFPNSWIGCWYAKRRGIRHVHTEHGSAFARLKRPWITAIAYACDQTLGRLVLRGADRAVAVSGSAARFAGRLGAKRVRVIHQGIRTQDAVFRGAYSEKEPNSLVFAGRLVYGKGVQDLLGALKGIPGPWTLAVIGDGEYRIHLETLTASYGLGTRVTFLGFREPSEVHRRLARSRIFVNPSYTEGFGLSTLEAGLEGCAVVVSNVGGLVDIVEDGVDGYLVDGFDPLHPERHLGLRQRLVDLLEHPKRCQRFGERLRRKIQTRFLLDQTVQRYRHELLDP